MSGSDKTKAESLKEKKVRAYNLMVEINKIMSGVRDLQNDLNELEADIAKMSK